MLPTSSRARIRANRRNARRSTGPKTPTGKARASKNAFRHGLAIRHIVDADRKQRIRELAGLMIGSHQDADCLDLALRVAAAELDLLHVRAVRMNIAAATYLRLAASGSDSLVAELGSCERYECRALSRRQRAMREFDLQFGPVLRTLTFDHVQ